ncbi:MAG: DUF6314 family protein [Janthinobacterium lividum]
MTDVIARDAANGTPEQDAAAEIRHCFDRLEGAWRLDRRILDRPWHAAQAAEDGAGRETAGHATAPATAHETGREAQLRPPSVPGGMPTMRARLHGEARFRRLGEDRLAYAEEGTLVLANGARMRAVRRYVYRLEGAALLVEFADGPDAGRRYLRFDAVEARGGQSEKHPARGRAGDLPGAGWRGSDRHSCGRDLYEAAYRFRGFDDTDAARRIVQRTAVSGPRKAYAIVTLLRPLPG